MDWIRKAIWPWLLCLTAGIVVPNQAQAAVTAKSDVRQGNVCLWTPPWQPSTSRLLSQLGLIDLARHHPDNAFSLLEQTDCTHLPIAQRLLALAELANQFAHTTELTARGDAILWSRNAAVYAVFCLATLDTDDDHLWHAASDTHNRALARCLRLVQSDKRSDRNAWPVALEKAGIILSTSVSDWAAIGFDTLQITSNAFFMKRDLGEKWPELGVPISAHRQLANTELTTWKAYGPGTAVFAVTAVLKPCGSLTTWRQLPVTLVLHEPLREEAISVGSVILPLARDLATPLSQRLAQPVFEKYECLGLIDPTFYDTQAGVYAVDAYQPGKIPFVLVHGIWSSPKVWNSMLQVLRNDHLLRAAYQFWVVLYPSGYPVPLAARFLRQSLRDIRRRFDPHGLDRALDQIVVLGKSTGGQVAKMLVQSSDDTLWNAIFTQSITEIPTTTRLRTELAEIFFFEPEPYIRRMIFLTTGHRGSRWGEHRGVRFSINLIRRNNPLRATWAELKATSGQTVFQPYLRNQPLSSADGLETENPMLMALDDQPIAPTVAYHSIIANIRHHKTPEKMSDGFVNYRSAVSMAPPLSELLARPMVVRLTLKSSTR